MDFNVYITLPPTMILRCDVATRGSNIPELNKYLCEMYEGVVISLRIVTYQLTKIGRSSSPVGHE